jgi:NADH-quinone oxidoreductase subunit G
MTSELQGNVIDLCPVGALTSRPYAFQARPWELTKTDSFDAMDAVGSAIRVDTRGREVMRILPRVNDLVNEEWISDKTRFVWDGLRTQRLDRAYVRTDGRLAPVTWRAALDAVASKLKATAPEKIGFIGGDLQTAEEFFAFKDLAHRLGIVNVDARQDGTRLDPADGRVSYLFNATIAGIEAADAILLVGTNPRLEAAVLNARIRKLWRAGPVAIGVIGERADLTYDYDYLGAGGQTLAELAAGSLGFAGTLKNAERPLIIVGQGALSRPDGAAVLAAAAKIAKDCGAIGEEWNGFSVLHTAAGRVGALDVGCVPGEGGLSVPEMLADDSGLEVVFLLGADEIDTAALSGKFVVYLGTHGDAGAHAADVILQGAAYTEKAGTFVNTEGRPQFANRAAFPPGEAREDWAILRALSAAAGAQLPYDSFAELRRTMLAAVPYLADTDMITPADPAALDALAGRGGDIHDAPFLSPIKDFYLTNPITRASAVMAECSALAQQRSALAAAE